MIKDCETIDKHLHVEKSVALMQSQWMVIVVASTRLIFEFFQMFMVSCLFSLLSFISFHLFVLCGIDIEIF